MSKEKLESHAKIIIALNSINWSTMRAAQLLSNFRQINHVNSHDVTEELQESYERQLAETERILVDAAQDLADFLNENDATDIHDKLVLDGGFEILNDTVQDQIMNFQNPDA